MSRRTPARSPRGTRFATAMSLALLLVALSACQRGDPLEGTPEGDAAPPYPIVMAHGFFGFETLAGIDAVTYFFGVRNDLAEIGEFVYTPAVDPFNDSEVRGAELLDHIERVIEETGAARVNIIAHSQGGLDARFAASLRPDLIESITTIATPHRGSRVADIALGIADIGPLPDVLDAVTRIFGGPFYDALGNETSIAQAARQLSTPGATAFDAAYPPDPRIAWYSIAGRTGLHRGGAACRVDDAPAFIERWSDAVDPVDPLFALMEPILAGDLFDRTPNDGLVTVPSARFGRFLGCIPADHLDEMGQLLGDLPGLINPFRHRVFYRDLVGWLRSQGH